MPTIASSAYSGVNTIDATAAVGAIVPSSTLPVIAAPRAL
jgi:hypothetical protein